MREPVDLTIRSAVAILLLPLIGCAKDGYTVYPGGASRSTSWFAADIGDSVACRHYDPITGAMTTEVLINHNANPNAAAMAEMGSIGRAAIGLLGAAKAAGTMGMGARSEPTPSAQPAYACPGEQIPGQPATAPATPQPSFGSGPHAESSPAQPAPRPGLRPAFASAQEAQPRPPPVSGAVKGPYAPSPSLYAPGPHPGRDGRLRTLEAVYGGTGLEQVWYTQDGRWLTMSVAAWRHLDAAG